MKRRSKLLDEKEEKILLTYRTIEEAMEEFSDRTDEIKSQIDQKLKKLTELTVLSEQIRQEQKPAAEEKATGEPETGEMQIAKKPARNQIAFQQLFNEITVKTENPYSSVRERVLALARPGKAYADIAKELKITQNEVELIVGINKTQRIDKTV